MLRAAASSGAMVRAGGLATRTTSTCLDTGKEILADKVASALLSARPNLR